MPSPKSGHGTGKRLGCGAQQATVSNNFFALGDLARPKERFDQLALAADGHRGKALEPLSLWHFRVRPEPSGELDELPACDLTLFDTIDQMPKKRSLATRAAES
jgi:hypothetical protein